MNAPSDDGQQIDFMKLMKLTVKKAGYLPVTVVKIEICTQELTFLNQLLCNYTYAIAGLLTDFYNIT
jgi:hypothetical protein